jgi:hypothetical protein
MRTIPAIIEHNASFQQGAPVSAVDLLSDYEPATEVPTILANCGQQRDVLRPLRVRASAASLSRRNIKVGCGSWRRENADVLRCRRMVFSRVRCASPLARSSPLGAHRTEVQKSRQFRDSCASGTRLTYHLSFDPQLRTNADGSDPLNLTAINGSCGNFWTRQNALMFNRQLPGTSTTAAS